MFVQLVALISPILPDKSQAAMRGPGEGCHKGASLLCVRNPGVIPSPREPEQKGVKVQDAAVCASLGAALAPGVCPEQADLWAAPREPTVGEAGPLAPCLDGQNVPCLPGSRTALGLVVCLDPAATDWDPVHSLPLPVHWTSLS